MAVTIADIAREAGVSISTVSRVINNTKPVSPDLRERVYKIIEKNNFKPNSLAQGLVTKQTHMVGVIVPDISNAVFGALTKGIASVCEEKGYTIIVSQSDSSHEKELKLLEVMGDKKMDGVLFAGVDVNDKLVQAMKEKEYPVVLVTQEAAGGEGLVDTVVHDNIQAMYEAVSFLIDNGHQRIAFISGPKNDYSSGIKRMQGYEMAMQEHELEIPDAYIEYGDFSFESGHEAMRKIYQENSVLPTAVMACSDIMAVGAIQFLQKAGVNVPEEISVMGFDDMELAVYLTPELSTVRIPYFEEGAKAAKELIKLIGKKEASQRPMTHFIPHKVIRRNSVKRI